MPLQPLCNEIGPSTTATGDASPTLPRLKVSIIAEEQLSVGMGDRVQLVRSGEEMQLPVVTARVHEVSTSALL